MLKTIIAIGKTIICGSIEEQQRAKKEIKEIDELEPNHLIV